jgi:hypothetical protein
VFSNYCREFGLFVDQVKCWKQEFMVGFQISAEQIKDLKKQTIEYKNEI